MKFCECGCGAKVRRRRNRFLFNHHSGRPAKLRFWDKVKKGSGCWEWQGFRAGGYGRIWVNGGNIPAHRFAFELLVGPVPEGWVVHHLCGNRACVNPDHLEATTQKAHIAKHAAAGFGVGPVGKNLIKTHCKNGHEFTAANTQRRPSGGNPVGGRVCRQCAIDRKKRYRARLAMREHQGTQTIV